MLGAFSDISHVLAALAAWTMKSMGLGIMLFTLEDCGGCRTCELACSFKLTGDFNFHVSAIEIIEKEDRTGYLVNLIDEAGAGRQACTGCPDDQIPACVAYCHKGAELQALIDAFIEARHSRALAPERGEP